MIRFSLLVGVGLDEGAAGSINRDYFTPSRAEVNRKYAAPR
jgi:hypothetical protein